MAHPKSVLQKRVACIRRMQFKGLGFPNKHFATQNGLCIYEDTACYGYERLLNCKMIFQLLYWAYQIFFREDAAVTAQTIQIRNRPCRIYGEPHAEYLLLQMTGEHELQSIDDEVAAIAQSNRKYLFAAIPVESWNDALSPWEAPAVWGSKGLAAMLWTTPCAF